jgi:hypothetical protein
MKTLEAEVATLRETNIAYEQVFTAFKHTINGFNQTLDPQSVQKSIAVNPNPITIQSQNCDQTEMVSSKAAGSESGGLDLADRNNKARSVDDRQLPTSSKGVSADSRSRDHPFNLDTAQIAVEFVLDIERTRSSHHGFEIHGDDFPAVEVEKLLQLSSKLSLEGELTPIEAWYRIKQHPGFVTLNQDRLEQLKVVLLPGVRFYE